MRNNNYGSIEVKRKSKNWNIAKTVLGAGENSHIDLHFLSIHFTFRFCNINFGTEVIHKYLSWFVTWLLLIPCKFI